LLVRRLVPIAFALCLQGGCVPEITQPGSSSSDADGDGYVAAEDCDDGNAWVYPDAIELCDGVDNDCDDEIDENPPALYRDSDGDGFGDPSNETEASCEWSSGYSPYGTDCDDSDADVYPGAGETCDDLDNDCDDLIDEDDPDLGECGSGDTGTGGTEQWVAVVYNNDSSTADLFGQAIKGSGYNANLLKVGELTTEDLQDYAVIVVPPEASVGVSDWTESSVDVLRSAGLPVFGMHLPGYYLFGSGGFNLETGYPYGATTSITKLFVNDGDHDVFNTPSTLETSTGGSIAIASGSISSKPLYWDEDFDDVDAIRLASNSTDTNYAALTVAEGKYLYWAMGGEPDDYSHDGATLFINCLEFLLNVD